MHSKMNREFVSPSASCTRGYNRRQNEAIAMKPMSDSPVPDLRSRDAVDTGLS